MHSVIFGELLQECVVFVFCNLIVYEYLEHYRVEVTVIFWSCGGFLLKFLWHNYYTHWRK